MAGSRDLAWFVLLAAIAHAITYFLVGALVFSTLMHGLYEGADPLFGANLRTPGEIHLWITTAVLGAAATLIRRRFIVASVNTCAC